MGKKIRIYESEIKRATRRKLMEKILVEDYEMKDTYSKSKFKPTPRERGIEGVFGQYGEDMDPAVIRYMRKNPDHILRRMAKLYPEIYMRHMPAQPDYGDYRDDDDYMATYGVDVSLDEAEETTVKQTKYRPDEVNRAEQEGVGISVKDGTVTLDKDGGMTVTTKNESTEKLFKRFLNKK
jgi:hypothetical protein